MTLDEVYDYAQAHNIAIYNFRFDKVIALSVPDNIAIDYSKLKGERQEKDVLMHEISHNETGTFYGLKIPLETRARREFRARKWAWTRAIPVEELKQAVSSGYTEPWELADYFDVTEEQLQEAITYYRENGMI